jgi:hypothetical protein
MRLADAQTGRPYSGWDSYFKSIKKIVKNLGLWKISCTFAEYEKKIFTLKHMEALKNLPIGVQNFEKLRRDGYLYVDKTALMYRLAHEGCYYFLSRPRRFGKSMLISTLHAYFAGQKDLFEGLAIEQLEREWTVHPVLHLDLNMIKKGDDQALNSLLNDALCEWEERYGTRPSENTFSLRFRGVIRRAFQQTGQPVVILVDEYDKPLLQTIDNEALQEDYRSTLKDFYGVLKTEDKSICFALLTGVTKFSKVSVFSDLNNLEDISMSAVYASLCGITDEELDTQFVPYVQRLADALGQAYHEVREELRLRYDGYHFSEDSIGIYNPFSLLNTFKKNVFNNYWFETGTPSYLVYLLQKYHYNLEHMASVECDSDALNSIDPQSKSPIPVIYQSGYLTIKDFDPEFALYTLGFPNREVEDGFLKFLLPYYSSIDNTQSTSYITRFVKEIRAGQTDAFLKRLSILFADTPYELVKDLENHYQNVLFIVTKLLGFYVRAEYHTSEGRIDLLLQTADFTYVMEFKLDGTAEEALRQIEEKHYAQPFEGDAHRKLVKVGVNFSSVTRDIERWVVE